MALNFTKNSNRVNPVEVLYAAFPMFMYLDPDLGSLLLEPLLRYQNSNFYTQPFAAPDAGELYPSNLALRCPTDWRLGSFYPNTTFNNEFHQQGVERK